jgi:hypothetical protein
MHHCGTLHQTAFVTLSEKSIEFVNIVLLY